LCPVVVGHRTEFWEVTESSREEMCVVPRVRDLLNRFRPAGAPGAAGNAGVPVDRDASMRTELAPLFARLAPTLGDCADIVARARRDADVRRAADAERARSLLAQAQVTAPVERRSAASAIEEQVAADAAHASSAAANDLLELRERVLQRTPALVEQVVAAVSELLADDSGSRTARGAA
jgi:hypothetical protein